MRVEDFFDLEAEESDDSSSDATPRKKKPRFCSSDEDDIDDDKLREELKDLINDEEEEEYQSQNESESSDGLVDLVEDDIDMLEEHTGKKFDRRKMLRRVIVASDDENGAKEQKISTKPEKHKKQKPHQTDFDDLEDFIVEGDDVSYGDENQIFDDEQLQEARDLFEIDYESGDDNEDVPQDSISSTRDEKILNIDLPERFQQRSVPVTDSNSQELDEESQWIYNNAFRRVTLSQMTYLDRMKSIVESCADDDFVVKIKNVLHLIRNSKSEVPFIATFRKEVFSPVLEVEDLWKIYDWDEKWGHYKSFKKSIVGLFTKMKEFLVAKYSNSSIDQNLIEKVQMAEDEVTLRDWHSYFLMYYGHEIQSMNDYQQNNVLKTAMTKSAYRMCVDDGLGAISSLLGIENHLIELSLHEKETKSKITTKVPESPLEMAERYISFRYDTKEVVLRAVTYMKAAEIASDPSLLKCLREKLYNRACLSVKPTKSGIKQMTEDHPCYSMKYLKNKSVNQLQDEFLLVLVAGERDGLVKLTFSFEGKWEDELIPFFQMDVVDDVDKDWNNLRRQTIVSALVKMIYPKFVKEIREMLICEASQCVVEKCCAKLNDIVGREPYFGARRVMADETTKTVISVTYSSDRDGSSFAAAVDMDGVLVEVLKLPCLVVGRNSPFFAHKESTLRKLSDFIATHNPSIIVVSAEDRLATCVQDDIKRLAEDCRVELIDNDISKIYSHSHTAVTEFADYHVLLREAISLGRMVVDPVGEFTQLVNKFDDFISYRYHPLQDYVSRDRLSLHLQRVIINVVNNSGIDINRVRHHHHVSNLLQFVAGLGPIKSKIFMKDEARDIIARSELVTNYKIGPMVFVNCAGFLLVNPYYGINNRIWNRCDPIDQFRIHPEVYHWARKMVVDALDYDDPHDLDNDMLMDELMSNREKLRDLDLEAFSVELEKQNFGNKINTLLDIREQFYDDDMDVEFRRMSSEERFFKLLKETPESLYLGKLVTCRIIGYARKKPSSSDVDSVRPRRKTETGQWECPFCKVSDYETIDDVMSHVDLKQCPGGVIGLRVAFENGLVGFIHKRNVSDRKIDNLERIKIGSVISARISKLDYDRIQCELVSKGSVLGDRDNHYRIQKDVSYDYQAEERDLAEKAEVKRKRLRKGYSSRAIVHANFKNVSYHKCCEMLKDLESGDCLFRPSSKGVNHLTLSWKVADEIYSHVDIEEFGKDNSDLRLGKVLKIDGEAFEDLDEIIARFLHPIISYVRDVVNFQYFLNGDDSRQMERYLVGEKKRQTARIPYGVSLLKEYPGKAVICYFVNNAMRKEYFSITWHGIKYRNKMFKTVKHVVDHFKAVLSGRA